MSACIGIESFEEIIKERNKRYKNKVQYNATLKKRIVNKQKRMRSMSGIKFKRNKESGELEAYKDGKKVSEVTTMGDEIDENGVKQNEKLK